MAYDFNKQVEQESRSSIPKQGIYLEGVKFLRMTPKNPGEDITFKILPAFDPDRSQVGPQGQVLVDPTSWVPFRDAQGNLTPWGRYIFVAPFTGHGKEGKGSNRREIISLKSFTDDKDVYDPLSILLESIASDSIWKYLTEDRLDPDSPKEKPVVLERKAINSKLASKLLCNIVDLRKKDQGVFLAEFSSSAFDSLFAEGGLALAQNLNSSEEDIARNPMARWYVGDLTNMEENGPCFKVLKDPQSDRGKYAGYVIQVAFTAQKKPYRIRIEPEYLPYRYNLLDLSTVIKKPTEEELVNMLVGLFNQWNPTRQYHEYELLRQAFGHNFRIPDAPARGVGVGFGPSPAQAPVNNFGAPPTQHFPGQAPIPGLPPQMQSQGQFPAAPQSQQQFPAAKVDFGQDDIPMGTMQPPMTKVGAQQQAFSAAPPQQAFSAAPQFPAAPPTQGFAPQAPQQQQQQQQPVHAPQPGGVQAMAPAQQQQQQAPIPGDPIPKFNRNKFLDDVKQRKK